ncbi:MAG: leucine-rich repeat domain-containing protein [Ruminococcus sp.]
MKRVISIVLSLIIFCTLFSTTTVSAKVNKGKCGKNITYKLDTTKKKLTISGKGDMYGYLSLRQYPFSTLDFDNSHRKYFAPWVKIKTYVDNRMVIGELAKNNCQVSVGEGITSIGSNAFYGVTFTNPEQTFTLPNTVKKIYGGAFMESEVDTIKIPDNVSEISSKVVYYKDNREYPSLGCFEDCSAKKILISEKSKLKHIGDHAFQSCSVEYFNENNSFPNVTYVGYEAFFGCDGISSISLPKAEVYGRAFIFCENLKKADVSGTKKIRDYTFRNCPNLEEVKLGNKLTFIGRGAFQSCVSLKKITIPKNVQKIKDVAFKDAEKLKTVVIESKNLKAVGDSAFMGVSDNVVFKVPKSKLKQYKALISPNAPKKAKFVGI